MRSSLRLASFGSPIVDPRSILYNVQYILNNVQYLLYSSAMGNERDRKRRPGERARIAHSDVVDAAVRVYRAGGVEAVSMRAVAEELGVAPNALYSHVATKDVLIDELVDALFAEVRIPESGMAWRSALVELMESSRTVLLRYGDLMPAFLSRPTRGPNARRLGEVTLRLLAEGGISGELAVDALRILVVYTFGFVAQEYPRSVARDDETRRARTRAAFLDGAPEPITPEIARSLSEHPDNNTFTTGLHWLVDGISTSSGSRST